MKTSSAIKSFARTEKGLEILYEGVPANVILGLERAESKGSYFSAEIRDKYKATKIA